MHWKKFTLESELRGDNIFIFKLLFCTKLPRTTANKTRIKTKRNPSPLRNKDAIFIPRRSKISHQGSFCMTNALKSGRIKVEIELIKKKKHDILGLL